MEIKQIGDLVQALQRAKGDVAYPCGKAVFLVGAGCSKSAGVPLGSEIVSKCLLELAKSYSNGEVEKASPDEALAWLKTNRQFPEHGLYGYLFEHHYQDPTDQQRIILEAINSCSGKINWAHLCLGELVNKRYVHTVLTTNFDQLVLEGIIRTGILPVVADGVESLTRVSGKPSTPQVVHLHGSMHTYRPLNSATAIRDTDQELPFKGAMYSLLHDSSLLIVIGYAGGEEGVMSMLIESAKRLPDKVIYWVQRDTNPDELSVKAKELLGCGKNKFLVPDQDADAFFAELMKGLALGTPDWMRRPVASLQEHASRIASTDNKEISGEVARYQKRLGGLERHLEQEDFQEKMLGDVRELRLANKHLDALGLLRKMEASNDPEIWGMRAESAYQAGRHSLDSVLLEESIQALKRYLMLVPKESFAEDWADGQNNLGVVLSLLGKRESGAEKLRESVAAYEKALEIYTRERMPMQWAAIQHNRGASLATLGQRESDPEELQEAVVVFEETLKERARERDPLAWAMTQCSLGNALKSLGVLESDVNMLKRAVSVFEEALKEWTRERVPSEWALTQNNMGGALRALGEYESDPVSLQRAIAAFEEAHKERTLERSPVEWAQTQSNMGNALMCLGNLNSDVEQLERARDAYQDALKVFRELGTQYYIQRTELNLSMVLSLLEQLNKT
jgi:tetratricopeptide (TPR) repeat protein